MQIKRIIKVIFFERWTHSLDIYIYIYILAIILIFNMFITVLTSKQTITKKTALAYKSRQKLCTGTFLLDRHQWTLYKHECLNKFIWRIYAQNSRLIEFCLKRAQWADDSTFHATVHYSIHFIHLNIAHMI